jgi:hypothetical protein
MKWDNANSSGVDDIAQLGLSARPRNSLINHAGITSIAQLREITDRELRRIPHLGQTSLTEIREALKACDKAHPKSAAPRPAAGNGEAPAQVNLGASVRAVRQVMMETWGLGPRKRSGTPELIEHLRAEAARLAEWARELERSQKIEQIAHQISGHEAHTDWPPPRSQGIAGGPGELRTGMSAYEGTPSASSRSLCAPIERPSPGR